MALSLRDALAAYDAPIELVGVPLRPSAAQRVHRPNLDMLAEVAHLKEVLAAKDAHIETLETMVLAWKAQAQNEGRARVLDGERNFERERDLIRVIHHQLIELEGQAAPPPRSRWWRRGG